MSLKIIGDIAFPRSKRLYKCFNESLRYLKERYFYKKLCSARDVTENAYNMLKRRWRSIYKKWEYKQCNIKYVIMVVVLLHRICTHTNDLCRPIWRLNVDGIAQIDKLIS